MSDAHELKPSLCVSCGESLDAASGLDDGSKPRPGDITICLYCGKVMAFNNDLCLRHLNEVENKEIENDERINRAVKLIKSEKYKKYN